MSSKFFEAQSYGHDKDLLNYLALTVCVSYPREVGEESIRITKLHVYITKSAAKRRNKCKKC